MGTEFLKISAPRNFDDIEFRFEDAYMSDGVHGRNKGSEDTGVLQFDGVQVKVDNVKNEVTFVDSAGEHTYRYSTAGGLRLIRGTDISKEMEKYAAKFQIGDRTFVVKGWEDDIFRLHTYKTDQLTAQGDMNGRQLTISAEKDGQVSLLESGRVESHDHWGTPSMSSVHNTYEAEAKPAPEERTFWVKLRDVFYP